MYVFVGLGNPGNKHENQRHNVGFMALDAIGQVQGFGPWKRATKAEALIAEGTIAGQKILGIKPQTFMNRSGMGVAPLVQFYKVPVEQVFVFYDELDLAPGKVKLKQGGGNGGHNGLRSLDQFLANPYWRVRIGIDHPGHKSKVNGHVLGDFTEAEQAWLDPLLTGLAKHAPRLLEQDKNRLLTDLALDLSKRA